MSPAQEVNSRCYRGDHEQSEQCDGNMQAGYARTPRWRVFAGRFGLRFLLIRIGSQRDVGVQIPIPGARTIFLGGFGSWLALAEPLIELRPVRIYRAELSNLKA